MVGKEVLQYRFLEKLGAGGMGEIYKALDTRLNRVVAIKVLAGEADGGSERHRRFIQEAQSASGLNHPNIITIHDIVRHDDAMFMVMEHVQGRTLGDLIPKGGLRVPQVLRLALQMTDALEAAHAAGIIHRDLKPGNVMVTEAGLVKILDFGLAKLSANQAFEQEEADDATRTIAEGPLTVEGSIIGTVSYMSPEQAQGKPVDARSDIFSLGVVLYEMVTGTRAFAGENAVSTLSAILRDEARPIPEIVPDVPEQLERLIWRCLRKEPDERFQTMREVHLALAALKQDSDSGTLYRSGILPPSAPSAVTPPPAAQTPKSPRFATPQLAAMVAIPLLLLAGGVWWMASSGGPAGEAEIEAAESAGANVLDDETLTNDSIIAMVEAGVAPEVIISQIRSSPNEFNLSAAEVIRLTQADVPGPLIEAMRDPASIPPPQELPGRGPGPPPKGPPPAVAKAPKRVPKGPPPAPPNQAKAPKGKAEPAKAELAGAEPPAAEQVTAPSAAPAAVAAAPPAPPLRAVVIPDATPFPIALSADIPEGAPVGRQLQFTTLGDVRIDGAVVITRGTRAFGAISRASERRLFRRTPMMLELRFTTAVDGQQVRLRALSSAQGARTERSVQTGDDAAEGIAASAGTEYIAYVDGDIEVKVPDQR